jgi:hypothetical protein
VDLLADDTPVFNLLRNKFEYGYSIIGKTSQEFTTETEV